MSMPEQFSVPAQNYPPYAQQYPPQQVPVARPTSGLAVAALVLGILWLWGIGSLLAVIFGHLAMSETRDGRKGGQGLAVAGLVLGWIGVAVLLLVIVGLGAA
jgi:Domain of unknown function (DUF4190)